MPLLEPVRPVIWGSGLRTLEAKWLDALAGRGLGPAGGCPRACQATVARLLWSTTRTGCTPLRRGRPPRARGAAAAPAAPARPPARGMADVLAPPPERPPAPPYARAWRDLCDPELDLCDPELDHVRSRADASRVLAGPVSLFCKASGSSPSSPQSLRA